MEKWKVKCLDCGAIFTEEYPEGLSGDYSYSDIEDSNPCQCQSQYELIERIL